MKLGHVALDGTKIKANASKHKAMSYARMKKREAELAGRGRSLAGGGEAADAEEDRLLRRPARRRDARLGGGQAEAAGEDPRQAKAELEAEAKAAAEAEQKARAAAQDSASRKAAAGPASRLRRRRSPTARRNATSPIPRAAS